MDQSELEANTYNGHQAREIKTRASKSLLVLVLLLIGWENGANFFNQSESVVKHQNKGELHPTLNWKPR